MSLSVARILSLADAVATDLNANVITDSGLTVTATRGYSLQDIDDLQVLVEPIDDDEDIVDRGQDVAVYTLNVLIRQTVDKYNVAEIDPLINLAKTCYTRYQFEENQTALIDNVNLRLESKKFFPLYSTTNMDNFSRFYSVLILIFTEWVDRGS